MRAVAGQPATIGLQVATFGGTAVAADAAPTITVTAGDGVTVLYNAQTGTAVSGQTGAYTWVLPAQTQLDQLTAVWSYTVSGAAYQTPVEINVVRERLVAPYLLRQGDPNLAGMSDAVLLSLVDQVEDALDDILGYPCVLSGGRAEWDVLRGTLTDSLYISGTVNGLPYGWGAGRMLIPGVKLPVLAGGNAGTAPLYTAINAGTVTSVTFAGDTVGVIGQGYLVQLVGSEPGPAVNVVTTSSGTYNGTSTTYTTTAGTVPATGLTPAVPAGTPLAYAAPAAGPGALYSGAINGVALDPVKDVPYLVVLQGALAWADYRPWISGRYQVWLTHGQVNPTQDIRWAAQKLVSHYGQAVPYPDRASQVVTEGATINFALPGGPDRPTGLPEVDAVLARRRLQSVI